MWQHGSCLVEGWSPGGAQSDLTLIPADKSVIVIIADPGILFFFSPEVAIPVPLNIWLRSKNLETKRGRVLPGTVRLWSRILTIPFRCWQKGKGGSWDLLVLQPGPHSSAQAIASPAWGVPSFLHCQCTDSFLQILSRFSQLRHLRQALHARKNI